ncbi:MAG: transporter substrate-binding domain-containing protein [Clostridiales bacterium]|nr:transporter substrate-binding domain-containing protein [Clostridiales bacterium]
MKLSGFLAICVAILLLPGVFGMAEAFQAADFSQIDYQKLGLTKDEVRFIQEHPVIRLGIDPEFTPYEFIDSDGTYKGIAADYLRLVEKATGLHFEVAPGLTWAQAYDRAVARQLDALPCISKTAQREEHFLFSDPYLSFQRVIFVNKDRQDIKTFEDLYGKTVAVQVNGSHHSFLMDYDQIKLNLYVHVGDALRAVSNGSEIAYVGNLATSNYTAKASGITNLMYIPLKNQENQSLYFAVRKDWPQLLSIMNKALAGIDEESRLSIHNKWISVEESADYAWIIRLVVMAAGVIVLVLTVSFFWITRLRKEVAMRARVQADLENAKREADEANAYKSSFMARMSHEIRTPLNGIMGMAYLLKKKSTTLTQKMYVDRITQSATNMLGIINDILDFSKIEAGKVELEIVPFSMDQVIQDVVNIVSYKIDEQKIGFVLTKDPKIPNWFLGDAKRLEQILINILNNAAKFTSKGEVALDFRLVAQEGEKYHLAFTVKDTGVGMSEEQIKKLFVPFMQGDSSINRRFGGTGLGLSIVKNLLDMMGGHLQVFSTPGESSTFIIHLTLPLDREKEEEYRRSISTVQFRDIRTLVLEKTASNMNLIQNYLESFGMHCELTTSAVSALGMLQAAGGKYAKPFDLLIVDYYTPEEGAFEFVQRIAEDPRIARKPKTLMLLPMMREDLFDQLGERGVDFGIGKPIIPSILLNAIIHLFQLKTVSALHMTNASADEIAPLEGEYCVLVVEDNVTNQFIAKSLLEQIGVKVLLAENGKVALEEYSREKDAIDLILMDLHMPVMNGYEASAEIRKISQDVPIAAMTADVVMGVKEKCEEYGIGYFLSKPFEPGRFIRTVKEILSGREHKKKAGPVILDPAAGLAHLGQDPDLYAQVLRVYQAENQDTPSQLTLAISQGHYEEAVRIVHKVKSSTGSIGAKKLFDLAVRLQKALAETNEHDISALGDDFSGMLSRLLVEIQDLLKEDFHGRKAAHRG